MKLIYILSFDLNAPGGPNLVSQEKADAMKKILGDENVEIWYPKSGNSKFSKYFNLALFDSKCATRIMQLDNKNQDYRIIFRVTLFPLSQQAIRYKGIQAVYEVHADFENEIAHMPKRGLDMTILKQLVRFDKYNFRKSRGFIYNHPILLQKFKDKYPQPSIFTYNGVNPLNYKPGDKYEARNELNIPKERKVALFLGSISKWHGVNYLIDIWNHIKETTDIYLYIVGATDTPYVAFLKNEAADNTHIIFVDRVPPQTARTYINAADICLLPVDNIRTSPGSPIKLYEYAACGKPILSQENTLGYSDEIEKYNLGKTTDFTNKVRASQDLLEFFEEDLEKYRQSNIKSIQENLTWEHRIKKWIDFISKLS